MSLPVILIDIVTFSVFLLVALVIDIAGGQGSQLPALSHQVEITGQDPGRRLLYREGSAAAVHVTQGGDKLIGLLLA